MVFVHECREPLVLWHFSVLVCGTVGVQGTGRLLCGEISKAATFNSLSNISVCQLVVSPLIPHFKQSIRQIRMCSPAPFWDWGVLSCWQICKKNGIFLKLFGRCRCSVWERAGLCAVSGVWGSAMVLSPLHCWCSAGPRLGSCWSSSKMLSHGLTLELGTNPFSLCVY